MLGHSSYTYAEATWTQTAADWIGAHMRAFAFFRGSPAAVVPDNLKSGVTKADRYDPDLNPAYQEFARHYGLAILPARVRKPRDKASVESGVLLVERWILARLRDATFFSLAALNEAIRVLVAELNAKPFKKREGSRASIFAATDRPALRPLPDSPYEYATWKKAKVSPLDRLAPEHWTDITRIRGPISAESALISLARFSLAERGYFFASAK